MIKFSEFVNEELNEGVKANYDTVAFVTLMQQDDDFFNYVRDEISVGANGDIAKQAQKIKKFLKELFNKDNIDITRVQDGWVFAQLERGMMDKVDFKKDYSEAL